MRERIRPSALIGNHRHRSQEHVRAGAATTGDTVMKRAWWILMMVLALGVALYAVTLFISPAAEANATARMATSLRHKRCASV